MAKTTAGLMLAVVGVVAGCAPSVPPQTLVPVVAAMNAAREQIAPVAARSLEAEADLRRADALRRGERLYFTGSGCNPQVLRQVLTGGDAHDQAARHCGLNEDGRQRALFPETETERVLRLMGDLSDYVSAIDALARADSPQGIGLAATALIGEVGALIGETEGAAPTGWLFAQGAGVGGVLRFGFERYRAQTLRRSVRAAQEPVLNAVNTIVGWLLEPGSGRDPSVATFRRLAAAERAYGANPRSAGAMAELRAAHRDHTQALARSPAQIFAQVQVTHAALASRLSRGATMDEVLALVNELARLRAMLGNR